LMVVDGCCMLLESESSDSLILWKKLLSFQELLVSLGSWTVVSAPSVPWQFRNFSPQMMEGPGVLPLATKMSSGSGREFKHLGLKYKHLWPVLHQDV
jgi:hypothetical protein